MHRYCALQAIVFMMAYVFVFDHLHRRNRAYRRLREMYEGLKSLGHCQ
jgi:hypothetical protein